MTTEFRRFCFFSTVSVCKGFCIFCCYYTLSIFYLMFFFWNWKYPKRTVVYKKLWFSHNTKSFIDNLNKDLGCLQTPLLRSSLQRFCEAANIGQACEHKHGWKNLQVICQKKTFWNWKIVVNNKLWFPIVIFYVFDIRPAFFVCTSESKERGGPLNNLLSGDS